MAAMTNRIVACLLLIFIGLSSALLFWVALAIWALTAPFDRRRVALHLFSCFWASLYLWVTPPWRVRLEGRERMRRGATYVIVSNHQSQLDILAAFRLFYPFKWVSKVEVFRLPFIGWNMRLNRYIPLKRGDRESIRQMFAACERALAAGSSVFFFPEGTRSETGRLRPFKPGAFALALKLGLPLLPVAINGTRRALPKGSLNFSRGRQIRLTVLEEIPPQRYAGLSAEALAEEVRGLIADHVDEHRAPQTG
jgi:1-acyl-sn-glycerol-3-phosphate acyltransferase